MKLDMLFSDKYVSSYFPHKNLANYVYLGDIPKVSGFIRINFLFFYLSLSNIS